MLAQANKENIQKAAEYLKAGELVAFPTETVYGLGAVAFDEKAVKRIFEVKGRPFFDPLIVHISKFEELSSVADWQSDALIHERVLKVRSLWPGPLTLILPRRPVVPDIVTAKLSTVAVRIPSHTVAQQLLLAVGKPVAAPSANPFSYVSPTTARHVDDLIGNKISMVLDGGPTEFGIESTILSLTGETPEILRPGIVTKEELERLLGKVNLRAPSKDAHKDPLAPGMLEMHYAPRTPLIFSEDYRKASSPQHVGYIAFSAKNEFDNTFSPISILSKTGDLNEVAHKLFAAIREQDQLGLDLIVIDSCPKTGIGLAIMDRLGKAVRKTTSH